MPGRTPARAAPRELPSEEPLARRVGTALAKIALALRTQAWREAGGRGLTPTQGQVLAFLRARRGGPSRLQEVADALGVRTATASEAVQALQRKRLLTRARAADARSLSLGLTARGRAEAARAASWVDFLAETVSTLGTPDQAALLRLLTRTILGLQARGLIPVSAMCVTCRFFRPQAHPGSARPHHCDFVDRPFGDAALRLDCADHEPASGESAAAAAWAWLQAHPRSAHPPGRRPPPSRPRGRGAAPRPQPSRASSRSYSTSS